MNAFVPGYITPRSAGARRWGSSKSDFLEGRQNERMVNVAGTLGQHASGSSPRVNGLTLSKSLQNTGKLQNIGNLPGVKVYPL